LNLSFPWLTELYTQETPRLINIVARLLGDRASAEEIVQETFLRLSQSDQVFESPANAQAWLTRVASNLALDALRRRKLITFQVLEDETENSSTAPSAAESWEAVQIDSRFTPWLAQLPPRQRLVFLARLDGYKNSEIATNLGLSPGAVRVLYTRARMRIQRQIKQETALSRRPTASQLFGKNLGEIDMTLNPYQIGETLWFLDLTGEVRGPLKVLAGPGRAPRMQACRMQAENGLVEELDARELWRDSAAFRALATGRQAAWTIHTAWYEAKNALLGSERGLNLRATRFNFRVVGRELRKQPVRLWIDIPDYVTGARNRAHYLTEEAAQVHPYLARLYQKRLFAPDGSPLRSVDPNEAINPAISAQEPETIQGDPRLGAILTSFRTAVVARGTGQLNDETWRQALAQMRSAAFAKSEV
jgi:RNA polymerase sigma-70 factor (ECF subfamily)